LHASQHSLTARAQVAAHEVEFCEFQAPDECHLAEANVLHKLRVNDTRALCLLPPGTAAEGHHSRRRLLDMDASPNMGWECGKRCGQEVGMERQRWDGEGGRQ